MSVRVLLAEDQAMVRGTTLGFAIVVRSTTSRQKTEAIEDSQLIRKGIRHPLLEPADGSSADPG